MKLRNFKKIIAVSVLFASSNVFSADTPLTTDELGNLMAVYINKATDVMIALRDNKADKAEVANAFDEVESEIAKNTNELEIHSEILQELNTNKVDKTEVANAFDVITDEIVKKADKAEVANAFDETEKKLNTLDETKADKADVVQQFNATNAILETKADKTEIARVDNKININTAGIRALDTRVRNNTALIQNIDDKVSKLDKKVRKGLAAQAALSGLFQPYNVGKANVTAAVGGYKSNTAIAIGTGYRFNEHVAAKAGVALSTGSGKAVSYNVGVNYEW